MTMIVEHSCFLNESDEMWTGDAVMVAYLAPPHPGETSPRVVWVPLNRAAEAMGFFAADRMHRDGRENSQSCPMTDITEDRQPEGVRIAELKGAGNHHLVDA
jgi:hypothetical protein